MPWMPRYVLGGGWYLLHLQSCSGLSKRNWSILIWNVWQRITTNLTNLVKHLLFFFNRCTVTWTSKQMWAFAQSVPQTCVLCVHRMKALYGDISAGTTSPCQQNVRTPRMHNATPTSLPHAANLVRQSTLLWLRWVNAARVSPVLVFRGEKLSGNSGELLKWTE